MKLGIMQPYFLPYLGYWQLMNAVDTYVIYDDVNYIKNGWINRNRMLSTAGKDIYFTLSLDGAGSFKKINEIDILQVPDKIIKTIQQVYRKAPNFMEAYPLIENVLFCQEKNLAKFLAHSIKSVADYLEMKTKFIISSELDKNNDLRAEEKVLHICELLGADEYYNAIGGQELYSKDVFAQHGIKLSFLETELNPYPQFKWDFMPGLSILDILMFNSKSRVQEMLREYTLV